MIIYQVTPQRTYTPNVSMKQMLLNQIHLFRMFHGEPKEIEFNRVSELYTDGETFTYKEIPIIDNNELNQFEIIIR